METLRGRCGIGAEKGRPIYPGIVLLRDRVIEGPNDENLLVRRAGIGRIENLRIALFDTVTVLEKENRILAPVVMGNGGRLHGAFCA